MKWILINSGANSGQYNMDLDLEMARELNENTVYFRLYRWDPYCISIGFNQDFDEIDSCLAKASGIEVVKRPTGGRAILHSEELTYSIILPTSIGKSAKQIYLEISEALIMGLINYNSKLSTLSMEGIQPDFSRLLKEPSGSLCFASTAKNEVKFEHKKLIGSAQRKFQNVILQHGSILCGNNHLELPRYLNIENAEKEKLQSELFEKTISIEDITSEKIDYEELGNCLVVGVQEYFGIQFENEEIPHL